MKNRDRELSAVSKLNECFNESNIPLFEIIRDTYTPRYELDENNEYKYKIITTKRGNKIHRKIRQQPGPDDINTLDIINEKMQNKKAFIDFFRFNPTSEYKKFDIDKIQLSWNLNTDFHLYKNRLIGACAYANFIPTISIKQGYEMDPYELQTFCLDLQKNTVSMAIRITDDLVSAYQDVLNTMLRSSDFLLVDIREQNLDSRAIELSEIAQWHTIFKKLLLNSPRKADIKNGDYEVNMITNKIDNSVATRYTEYKFNGFGDFGGLKDNLPAGEGSNGMGAALGLLYNHSSNSFLSCLNPNTSDGMRGYRSVTQWILQNLFLIDSADVCPTIAEIRNFGSETKKFGNWGTWNELALIRYIHQRNQ